MRLRLANALLRALAGFRENWDDGRESDEGQTKDSRDDLFHHEVHLLSAQPVQHFADQRRATFFALDAPAVGKCGRMEEHFLYQTRRLVETRRYGRSSGEGGHFNTLDGLFPNDAPRLRKRPRH